MRAGQGHTAMSCLDPAAAGRDRARLEVVDSQQIKAHCRANDVNDRIDGADLMEMDLRQINAVYSCLGFAQFHEDSFGQVFLARRSDTFVDDRLDVVPVAMSVFFAA